EAVQEGHDEVVALLGHPIQTNEVGRSAALLGGFLEVARGPPRAPPPTCGDRDERRAEPSAGTGTAMGLRGGRGATRPPRCGSRRSSTEPGRPTRTSPSPWPSASGAIGRPWIPRPTTAG